MKHYTVAKRRKAKKAQGGKRAMQAEWEAQESRAATPRVQECPLKAPTQARANIMAQKPSPSLLDPMLESEAGRALWVVCGKDERKKLYDLFLEYDVARMVYAGRVLNIQRFPAVSRMEYMPERLQASASDVVDMRSPEERVDAAKKAMREWDAKLDKLMLHQSRIIRSVSNRTETCVIDGDLTTAGMSFVAAMRALRNMLDASQDVV